MPTNPRGAGARFWKCALQVNPYPYVAQHHPTLATHFTSEEDYNRQMVEACQQEGIECVAVTDHHAVSTGASLETDMTNAGITCFRGFECCTHEGIHFLLLWDPGTHSSVIESYIAWTGILNPTDRESIGDKTAFQLFEKLDQAPVVVIAAHAAIPGGVLSSGGTSRSRIWQDERLLAAGFGIPLDDEEDRVKQIVRNQDSSYERKRKIAIVHSRDATGPRDLRHPGASTNIKMLSPTVEALRQAFLDPESRIRSNYELELSDSPFITSISWRGGLLDGQQVNLSQQLNVLIGGRGTGKSTVLQSLRLALNCMPLSEGANRRLRKFEAGVLGARSTVSVELSTLHPTNQTYRVEYTVGGRRIVLGEDGTEQLEDLENLFAPVEVYGQHELGEIADDESHLSQLLSRWIPSGGGAEEPIEEARRRASQRRAAVEVLESEVEVLESAVQRLPALLQTRDRYNNSGLQARVAEKTSVDAEEQALNAAQARYSQFREDVREMASKVPVAESIAADGPDSHQLANAVLQALDESRAGIQQRLDDLAAFLLRVEEGASTRRQEWEASRKSPAEARYTQVVQDLGQDGATLDAVVRVERQIGELELKQGRLDDKRAELRGATQSYREAVSALRAAETDAFEALRAAGRQASHRLARRVRVQVEAEGGNTEVRNLVDDRMTGQRRQTIQALGDRQTSPQVLAAAIRAGADAVTELLGCPPRQAQMLALMGESIARDLDLLSPPPKTTVYLNVDNDSGVRWRPLSQLSTGEKATALLLLVLQGSGPLVIDQPEDDLDNRFIAKRIVHELRSAKWRRQFVLASHNANIPVLGDAENIVVMRAGDTDQTGPHVAEDHSGSIDSPPVKSQVEQILEGGGPAFRLRRAKYGF